MADLTTTMTTSTDVTAGDTTGTAINALSSGIADGLSSGLTLSNVLAITAVALLVFVSGGVLYLSTVEWRDRRRRSKPEPARR